jgi:hypothetical protein
MGIFGWSLPPGCGELPGEASSAEDITAQVLTLIPALPDGVDAVYWDEDGNVIEGYIVTMPGDRYNAFEDYKDRAERTVLTVEWEDTEDPDADDCAHNAMKAARAYVAHINTPKEPPCS